MNSSKFFRTVWRVNAVVILLAAGAISLGAGALLFQEFRFDRNNRGNQAELRVDNTSTPELPLVLGRAIEVGESIQVELLQADTTGGLTSGLSSGGYRPLKNILFIQSGAKDGRWLLPDNNHVLVERTELRDEPKGKTGTSFGTAIVAKSSTRQTESETGRLILFNQSGRTVVDVASDVRTIQLAAVTNGELRILYERNRQLVLAAFDPVTLQKRREDEIQVPKL
jgi:hypothetical protein